PCLQRTLPKNCPASPCSLTRPTEPSRQVLELDGISAANTDLQWACQVVCVPQPVPGRPGLISSLTAQPSRSIPDATTTPVPIAILNALGQLRRAEMTFGKPPRGYTAYKSPKSNLDLV